MTKGVETAREGKGTDEKERIGKGSKGRREG